MPRGTRDAPKARSDFAYGAITLYGGPFQTLPLPVRVLRWSPTTPAGIASHRFGLIPFRSPLLGESRLIFLPPGTEMFQFPGFAFHALWIQAGMTLTGRVSPFGNPRIKDCSHLPAAYRRVPRPSSPLGAKASTVRRFVLDLHTRANPISRSVVRLILDSQTPSMRSSVFKERQQNQPVRDVRRAGDRNSFAPARGGRLLEIPERR